MIDSTHFGFPAGDHKFGRIAEGTAPAWLWTADGGRLLWANPAGASVLGITGPADATRSGSLQSIGHQIARFVPWLSYSGPPRLERVRGLGGGIGSSLTCACSRLQLADGSTAVLVVSAETRPDRRKAGPGTLPPGHRSDSARATGDDPVCKPSQTRATRSPDQRTRRPFRFTWHTDAEGVFTWSPELNEHLGAQADPLPGRRWSELSAALGLDPEGRIERALAMRDTFSGVPLAWPIGNTGQRVRLELSGLPCFDLDRRFSGFRGFGLCRSPPVSADLDRPLPGLGGDERDASTERTQHRPMLTLVPASQNVVPFRGGNPQRPALTALERSTFTEIAETLGGHVDEGAIQQPSNAAEGGPDADDASHQDQPAEQTDIRTWIPSAFAAGGDSRTDQAPASASEPAALKAEIRELRSILDTATDGVIVLDEGGTVLSASRSAEALFGYDGRELAGSSFVRLFAPESHHDVLGYLEGLTRAGVASLLNDGREVIGRVREGGLIPLFMTMGRIEGASRKFCLVLRDMTAWKRAEEELVNAKRIAEKASSAKSDFLAKISHEIRTPLNAIIGFAEVMIEERFGPVGTERYRDYLRDIQASGQHLISLVNDLLDLSKIEAGKLDLTFTSVKLNELVQQCVALMQPQANRERIIIRSSLTPTLPPVVVDARSVRQIMLNLLSNSIKFTGAGGQVIVSTTFTERGEVVLRVRDTGVGMTDKEIETAMEPFRQLPTSDRWGSGGTGLGLPLTKALAEANRAAFAIRSAANSGTLVEITFPSTRVLAE